MNVFSELSDLSPADRRTLNWSNVWLIYSREVRDQLRDRRTLFTIVVLPILLYPLVGTLLLQIAQFSREYATVVCVVGNEQIDQQQNPPLLDDDGFAPELLDSQLRKSLELVRYRRDEFDDDADIEQTVERWIKESIYDAVLIIEPSSETEPDQPSQFHLVFNQASDQSLVARDRLRDVLMNWREEAIEQRFSERDLDLSLLKPFSLDLRDVAPTQTKQAAFWSKVLPFVMLIWAMTGAFYPAIDLVAGEKERGTLETLLCSPALRGEIVWGKLAAVTTFSMLTATLNVSSMLVTSTLVFRQMAGGNEELFTAPPLVPLLWLIVGLVPLSALFSAVALAVAAMAKSSKEGQYYLMPLMMVSLPLVLLPLMPGTVLNTGTSLIPVTGMFLLIRALVEGQVAAALWHLPFVAGVTALSLSLAVRWARRQFETESVLFAGGEQWEFSAWAKRFWLDRSSFATAGQAYAAAAIVLIALFFGKLAVVGTPQSFAHIVQLVLFPQIGLILAPTLIMAIVCTRSLRVSLRMTAPKTWFSLPVALVLGVAFHPVYVSAATWISELYPVSDAAMAAMKPFGAAIEAAPWGWVVLLMAVVPAICEELTFRGFIFGGLVRDRSALRALMITSLVFGVSHGVLQQSMSATLMGVILGWVSLKSGSVWPSVLIHVTNNALSVSLSRISELELRGIGLILQSTDQGPVYQPVWVIVSGCLALCCLLYFTFLRQAESETETEKQLRLAAC